MAASSAFHRTLESISKFKGENYREWRDTLREAIALYSDDMVDILDGTPCPPATGANANAAGATAWTILNSKLYSILFFATEGSANITVKQFQARPQAHQKADVVGAWEALSGRFDGNRKEARRACREKLTHASMKSGEDPIDFLAKLDEQRLRLADMGETLTDESYEDIILRALPKEYDFVRQQSHMNRNFGLTGIKTTAINMFIDDLPRKSSASAVAGRGVAMLATQGHGKKQQYKRGKDNKKRGGGASKWCSFHRTRTHSDGECKKEAPISRLHKAILQRLDSLSPQLDPLRLRLVPRLPQRLRSLQRPGRRPFSLAPLKLHEVRTNTSPSTSSVLSGRPSW